MHKFKIVIDLLKKCSLEAIRRGIILFLYYLDVIAISYGNDEYVWSDDQGIQRECSTVMANPSNVTVRQSFTDGYHPEDVLYIKLYYKVPSKVFE